MTKLRVTVIADSVSRYGDRITTLECTFPRFLLPEFNTHRAFSRNSASSRARSVIKTIEEVSEAPFVPWHWPSERPGMAGGESVDEAARINSECAWLTSRNKALECAQELVDEGVHKSIVNRLLEPFMWHTAVVTATDWDGFFAQRLALLEDGTPAAEPHFYDLARAMRTALDESKPRELTNDQWHLPYVDYEQLTRRDNVRGDGGIRLSEAIRASVARCAGVSYLNQDADRPLERDLALYGKLRDANPPHWSPFEHVARPAAPTGEWALGERTTEKLASPRRYNLTGWESLRWLVESGCATLVTEQKKRSDDE